MDMKENDSSDADVQIYIQKMQIRSQIVRLAPYLASVRKRGTHIKRLRQ